MSSRTYTQGKFAALTKLGMSPLARHMATGAGGGSLVGGVTGALTDEENRARGLATGALMGAGVGAAGGTAVARHGDHVAKNVMKGRLGDAGKAIGGAALLTVGLGLMRHGDKTMDFVRGFGKAAPAKTVAKAPPKPLQAALDHKVGPALG